MSCSWNPVPALPRVTPSRTFQRFWTGLAVAGALSAAPSFAKDPAPPEKTAPARKPVATQPAGQRPGDQPPGAQPQPGRQPVVQKPSQGTAGTPAAPVAPAIPATITKLKLSPEQQAQVQGVIVKYDRSLGLVWKQFGERYMQTIAMESSLLAAIEDSLTDPQRNQVRAQRRRTAQQELEQAGTNDEPNQAAPNPNSAVEDRLAGVGISLTAEQEALADKVHEKYRAHLRSLNRDIEGLHIRLVSLEADKLVEIEKLLTKEQLAELRADRQTAPESPIVAATSDDKQAE